MLVARLAASQVVIELDRHDKLLVDALQGARRAGISDSSRLSWGCHPGLMPFGGFSNAARSIALLSVRINAP